MKFLLYNFSTLTRQCLGRRKQKQTRYDAHGREDFVFPAKLQLTLSKITYHPQDLG